jgi:ribosomal protein S14
MVILWYQRHAALRKALHKSEITKLLLKSLLSASFFSLDSKIYFGKLFAKYNKFSSFSFYHRFCVKTGFTHSVSRRFKMVRHQCKFYASNGYLVGLRKASF